MNLIPVANKTTGELVASIVGGAHRWFVTQNALVSPSPTNRPLAYNSLRPDKSDRGAHAKEHEINRHER